MDLIDRQQAIGKIKDWMKFIGYSHSERNVMECTIQMLEELPSAQPLNDDWEKYSDLEFSEPYYTDIQVLSQLRSMYNCFDPKEEPIYHALSMAIEALQEQKTGKWTIEDCHAATYKYCCSECNAHHRARYDFCPTCGTRMECEEE